MIELKKVNYTGLYVGNNFDIACWEGTSLGEVWNSIRSYYLPGSVVTITSNKGESRTFMRGVRG